MLYLDEDGEGEIRFLNHLHKNYHISTEFDLKFNKNLIC